MKQRLMAADARAAQGEREISRLRQAASQVDSGIMELQTKYDEILARMADEIDASQAEIARLQEREQSLIISLQTHLGCTGSQQAHPGKATLTKPVASPRDISQHILISAMAHPSSSSSSPASVL